MDFDPDQFASIGSIDRGLHTCAEEGMCVMEAVAWLSGGRWTDNPECACPVIARFARVWNDGLPDDKRTNILRFFVPLIVGTRSTQEVEGKRAFMALDWLVRAAVPLWIRSGNLDQNPILFTRANKLAVLGEIDSFASLSYAFSPLLLAAQEVKSVTDYSKHWRSNDVDVVAASGASAALHAARALFDIMTPSYVARCALVTVTSSISSILLGSASALIGVEHSRAPIDEYPALSASFKFATEQLQISAAALLKKMIEVRA